MVCNCAQPQPWRRALVPFVSVVALLVIHALVLCIPCLLGFIFEWLRDGWSLGRTLFVMTKESVQDWADEKLGDIQ